MNSDLGHTLSYIDDEALKSFVDRDSQSTWELSNKLNAICRRLEKIEKVNKLGFHVLLVHRTNRSHTARITQEE